MDVIWRWDVADEGYFDAPQNIYLPDWYSKEDVAADAAELYHAECDGWESDWPMKFRIYPPDSDEFTTITVDREYDPVFVARYGGQS